MNLIGVLCVVLLLTLNVLGQHPSDKWNKFVPLESDREDVERLLGKPENIFQESGVYRTDAGRFHVWYSTGGCRKDAEGIQWNVPAGKLTQLWVFPSRSLHLDSYVSNVKDFQRSESPGGYSRIHYISRDQSLLYETILREDSSEFVYTIVLAPSLAKRHLQCKNAKK